MVPLPMVHCWFCGNLIWVLSFMETGMLSYQHHRNQLKVKRISYMDGMNGNG